MPFERKPEPITFWTIALAVMIGILMADTAKTLALTVYARYQLNASIKAMNEQIREDRRQAAAKENAARIQAGADERARLARISAERQAAALAQQRAIDKEQAWRSFYTPPKMCESPPDVAVFTRCANEHVKAKTQFDKSYQPTN